MSADVLSPEDARAAREAVASLEVGRPLAAPNDAEVAALWRQTKALADSGLFASSRRGEALTAGEAFAKALAGRELGLGPFEAMQQLHVMPDGKLEASSDLHATKVREREGFDFEVFWIKSTTGAAHFDPQTKANLPVPDGEREAVPAKTDDPTDLRTVVGCAIAFSVEGEPRGVARWTIEDTLRANLNRDRGSAKSLHVTYPQSMYYARAMTNGVAWYVPEVMGGLRVYGIGELAEGPRDDGLTAGAPRGDVGAAPEDALSTEVAAIVARARELGHVGLGNAEVAARATVGQPAESVDQWCRTATRVLNALAAARGRGEDDPAPVPEPEAPTPDPTPEAGNARETAQDAPEGPRSDPSPSDEAETVDAEPVPDAQDHAEARARLQEALRDAETAAEDADAAGRADDAQMYAAEAAGLREQLAGLNPDQGSLAL